MGHADGLASVKRHQRLATRAAPVSVVVPTGPPPSPRLCEKGGTSPSLLVFPVAGGISASNSPTRRIARRRIRSAGLPRITAGARATPGGAPASWTIPSEPGAELLLLCLAHVPAGRVSARTGSTRDATALTPSVGVGDDREQSNGSTSRGVTGACRSVSAWSAWLCSCSLTPTARLLPKTGGSR